MLRETGGGGEGGMEGESLEERVGRRRLVGEGRRRGGREASGYT